MGTIVNPREAQQQDYEQPDELKPQMRSREAMDHDLTAEERIARVRIEMRDHARFFGYWTMEMTPRAIPFFPSIGVNPETRELFYNPDYIQRLSDEELAGDMAHEVMHLCQGDGRRFADVDNKRVANVAEDLVNNYCLVTDSPFEMCPNSLTPEDENQHVIELETFDTSVDMRDHTKMTLYQLLMEKRQEMDDQQQQQLDQQLGGPPMPMPPMGGEGDDQQQQQQGQGQQGDQQQQQGQGGGGQQGDQQQGQPQQGGQGGGQQQHPQGQQGDDQQGGQQGDEQQQGAGQGEGDQEAAQADQDGQQGQGDGEGDEQNLMPDQDGMNPLGNDVHYYDPDRTGDDVDDIDDEAMSSTERVNRDAMREQQQSTNQAGTMPSHLEEYLEIGNRDTEDWKQILQRYIANQRFSGYNRQYPDEDYLHDDRFVPAREKENIDVIIAIDTSGSMTDDDIRDALANAADVCGQFEEVRMTVIQHDAEVPKPDEDKDKEGGIQYYEYPSKSDFERFKVLNRGGTRFAPVLKQIDDMATDDARRPPVALWFTDGDASDMQAAKQHGKPYPELNIIWAQTHERYDEDHYPFDGDVIPLDESEVTRE